MELLGVIADLYIYIWLGSAVFWGIAAATFVGWAKIDLKIAIPVGVLFQGLGLIGLAIFYFVRKQNVADEKQSPFGNSSNDWSGASSVPYMAADPFGAGSTNAFDGSSAPAHNHFGGSLDEAPKGGRSWLINAPGAILLYGSIALVLSFTGSLFLTWFNISNTNRENPGINAFSTGLEFWIAVTIFAIAGAVLASLKAPSRVTPPLFAAAGSAWLTLAMAALTDRRAFVPAINKIFQIPDLLTTLDGYTTTWAYDVGTAWYVIFLNSLLLIGASILTLVAISQNAARQSNY
jgi:hypothetical protein